MSFLDKLSDIAKSAGDLATDAAKNVGNLAKNAGGKANSALEIGKLNQKIKTEKNNIENEYTKIGAYYYAKHAAGETLEAGAEEYCAVIDAANAAITGLEEEIAAIRAAQEAEQSAAPGTDEQAAPAEPGAARDDIPRRFCTKCGAQLVEGASFCASCGEKVG